MFYLYVTAPGMAARKLSLDRPVTTVGRSSMNDLPISDKMLSRQHARIVRDNDGALTVEDLGSRNGTFLNGDRLTTIQPLKPGDRITVGGVTLKVESESTTRVRIEGGGEDPLDNTILKASAELLRAHATETDPRLPAEQLGKLIESLRVVNELTVELLRDISVDELLGFLMDKVFETLHPDRGLVLLRSRATGELAPAVVRVAEGISAEDIRLSKTLVAAVVEKRNGLLLMDTTTGSGVSLADSIRLSGIKSVLAAPLENAGEVVGLIYVDCRVGHRSFEEADLRLLTSLANVAAAKIQNARLMEENAEKRQMDREFALAREIQQRLLPEDPPPLPGYELHGSNVASRQVSGDYFDFRPRPDGKIYATIADVCGKGVGPALLMASLQASFHAWADEGVPVAEMTGRLSEAISRRTGPDRFITFFLLHPRALDGRGRVHQRGPQPRPAAPHGRHDRGARLARPAARALSGEALRLLEADARARGPPLPLHRRRHRGQQPGGRRVRDAEAQGVHRGAGRKVAGRHRGRSRPRPRRACPGRALRGRPDPGDGPPASVSRYLGSGVRVFGVPTHGTPTSQEPELRKPKT